MSDLLKCKCPQCGQLLDRSSEGTGETIRCPRCEKLVTLTSVNRPTGIGSIVIPPAKEARTLLARLTEETIRNKTKKRGDTPLHRAARIGRIYEIPRHLLKTEMFLVKNLDWTGLPDETPMHIAAEHGCLAQIPLECFTKETLTVLNQNGSTPLHNAARNGHADQIPAEFLTLEFLTIRGTLSYGGVRCAGDTVLHFLADNNQLGILPTGFMTPRMWDLEGIYGRTVRSALDCKIRNEELLRVPATEKQKAKLRFFGCSWRDGITKGEASKALDECVKRFPSTDNAYYNRPATKEQMAKIRACLRSCGEDPADFADDLSEPLTYSDAEDWIQDLAMQERTDNRAEDLRENLISLVARTDFFPRLTMARVKKSG